MQYDSLLTTILLVGDGLVRLVVLGSLGWTNVLTTRGGSFNIDDRISSSELAHYGDTLRFGGAGLTAGGGGGGGVTTVRSTTKSGEGSLVILDTVSVAVA